jgi:hypothetical protein
MEFVKHHEALRKDFDGYTLNYRIARTRAEFRSLSETRHAGAFLFQRDPQDSYLIKPREEEGKAPFVTYDCHTGNAETLRNWMRGDLLDHAAENHSDHKAALAALHQ